MLPSPPYLLGYWGDFRWEDIGLARLSVVGDLLCEHLYLLPLEFLYLGNEVTSCDGCPVVGY